MLQKKGWIVVVVVVSLLVIAGIVAAIVLTLPVKREILKNLVLSTPEIEHSQSVKTESPPSMITKSSEDSGAGVSSVILTPLPKEAYQSISLPGQITCLSEYQEYLLLGCPFIQTYGVVYVFQQKPELKQVHELTFSMIGTPLQQAGFRIAHNWIFAPNYLSVGETIPEGAVFCVDHLEKDPEITRVEWISQYPFIAKTGTIGAFDARRSLMLVTKLVVSPKSQVVEVVDVTQLSVVICLQPNISPTLGQDLIIDARTAVMSDPLNGKVYVYNSQWEITQQITFDIDLHPRLYWASEALFGLEAQGEIQYYDQQSKSITKPVVSQPEFIIQGCLLKQRMSV